MWRSCKSRRRSVQRDSENGLWPDQTSSDPARPSPWRNISIKWHAYLDDLAQRTVKIWTEVWQGFVVSERADPDSSVEQEPGIASADIPFALDVLPKSYKLNASGLCANSKLQYLYSRKRSQVDLSLKIFQTFCNMWEQVLQHREWLAVLTLGTCVGCFHWVINWVLTVEVVLSFFNTSEPHGTHVPSWNAFDNWWM